MKTEDARLIRKAILDGRRVASGEAGMISTAFALLMNMFTEVYSQAPVRSFVKAKG